MDLAPCNVPLVAKLPTCNFQFVISSEVGEGCTGASTAWDLQLVFVASVEVVEEC